MKKIPSLMAAAVVAFGLGTAMDTPEAEAREITLIHQNDKITSCTKDGKEVGIYIYTMTHEQGAIDELVKWYDQAFDKLAAQFTAKEIMDKTPAYEDAFQREIIAARRLELDVLAEKYNLAGWGYNIRAVYPTSKSCAPPAPTGP